MRSRAGLAITAAVAIAALAGCATPTPPPAPPVERVAAAAIVAAPAPPPAAIAAPVIEYPPLEPVAPAVAPDATRTPVVAPPAATPPLEPLAEPSGSGIATEPTDEQQLASVLSDLQRYGAMSPDEIRREQNALTQLLVRQRTDFNRIRLAVLYTLSKTPQDDQRAVQLLETVVKSNPGSPASKQLAAVMQVQVAERMRAVRDEQQKADAAVKKLEALRNMERDLLRDRIRSGGGGGGGGSSGGGSGGGGGGGG
jgi:hypothetical protein